MRGLTKGTFMSVKKRDFLPAGAAAGPERRGS